MAIPNNQASAADEAATAAGAAPQTRWVGIYRDKKWWCDCEPRGRARCFTARFGPNKGKAFWTCPKQRKERQCPFFVWVEQEALAREWLAKSGTGGDGPVTPGGRDGDEDGSAPKVWETPWTKSKRKKAATMVVLDDSGNERREVKSVDDGALVERKVAPLGNGVEGGLGEKIDDDDDDGVEGTYTPSRKMVKRNRDATPGGGSYLSESLKTSTTAPFPTPSTTGNAITGKVKAMNIQEATPRQDPPSPTPHPARIQAENTAHLDPRNEKPNLAKRVLTLLREDGVQLKESTELQIRHEIDLESDLHTVRVHRCEETISTLRRRLDELETMVGHLTGDLDGGGEISD